MEEWLLASIDPNRDHYIDGLISWHSRLMVLAWGILIPAGALIARCFKVLPGQDWPNELDNKFWWRSHLVLQISGGFLMIGGLFLALVSQDGYVASWFHRAAGWAIIILVAIQFLSGWLRGTKGGPTEPAPDGSFSGDHYDMTLRRLIFERVHKTLGYVLIFVGAAAILAGLWVVNAPVWMWLALAAYWAGLIVLAVTWQARGRTIGTYQAIWGPDEIHPGNRRK